MDRSNPIKALLGTYPALLNEIVKAQRKAQSAQEGLNSLLQERDSVLKLFKLHKIEVPSSGEERAVVPQTGDLLGPTRRRGAEQAKTFRDTIRSVLSRSAEPMRPPEVARALEAMNYPYDQATPLATRMANELNRMSKAGSVEKIGQTYRLPGNTGEGAS